MKKALKEGEGTDGLINQDQDIPGKQAQLDHSIETEKKHQK